MTSRGWKAPPPGTFRFPSQALPLVEPPLACWKIRHSTAETISQATSGPGCPACQDLTTMTGSANTTTGGAC